MKTARTQQPGLYIFKPDGILGTRLAGQPVTLLPLPVPVKGQHATWHLLDLHLSGCIFAPDPFPIHLATPQLALCR